MDIGKAAEKLMKMDDAIWERHANPWSGWTRLSILPLFALVVWARVWIGWWVWVALGLLIVWTWLNPRLFARPDSTDNWMSRGVLGEQVWLAARETPIPAHHTRLLRVLMLATGLGVGVLIYGLWVLDFGLVLAGLIASMGGKLWFLDRMVWLLQDRQGGR